MLKEYDWCKVCKQQVLSTRPHYCYTTTNSVTKLVAFWVVFGSSKDD